MMIRLTSMALLLLPALAVAAEKPSLPAAWLGEWAGELVIVAPDGKTTKVPQTLSQGVLKLVSGFCYDGGHDT